MILIAGLAYVLSLAAAASRGVACTRALALGAQRMLPALQQSYARGRRFSAVTGAGGHDRSTRSADPGSC